MKRFSISMLVTFQLIFSGPLAAAPGIKAVITPEQELAALRAEVNSILKDRELVEEFAKSTANSGVLKKGNQTVADILKGSTGKVKAAIQSAPIPQNARDLEVGVLKLENAKFTPIDIDVSNANKEKLIETLNSLKQERISITIHGTKKIEWPLVLGENETIITLHNFPRPQLRTENGSPVYVKIPKDDYSGFYEDISNQFKVVRYATEIPPVALAVEAAAPASAATVVPRLPASEPLQCIVMGKLVTIPPAATETDSTPDQVARAIGDLLDRSGVGNLSIKSALYSFDLSCPAPLYEKKKLEPLEGMITLERINGYFSQECTTWDGRGDPAVGSNDRKITIRKHFGTSASRKAFERDFKAIQEFCSNESKMDACKVAKLPMTEICTSLQARYEELKFECDNYLDIPEGKGASECRTEDYQTLRQKAADLFQKTKTTTGSIWTDNKHWIIGGGAVLGGWWLFSNMWKAQMDRNYKMMQPQQTVWPSYTNPGTINTGNGWQ